MNEDHHSLEKRFSESTKLPPGWCAYALAQIAKVHAEGIILKELARLRHKANEETTSWDEVKERSRLEQQSPHQYAAQEVRPLILESIALACWKAVVEHARVGNVFWSDNISSDPEYQTWLAKRETRFASLDEVDRYRLWIQRQIGVQLGTSASNIGRWEDSKTLPGGEKVLGAVLIPLGAEFREINFPPRRDLLSDAAARTLSFIREKRYGKQDSVSAGTLPRKVELAAVREVLRHPLADELVPAKNPKKERVKALLANVWDVLKKQGSAERLKSPGELKIAIKKWATPFVLFRIALVSGWPSGTEDEWNWSEVDDDE